MQQSVPPRQPAASTSVAGRAATGAILLVLAFLGYIGLGLPDGLLGVAWPSIRRSFDLSFDALGPLLLTTAAGYLLSSSASGWVVARTGVGRLLALSGALTGVGLLGYALAPAWWLMVVLGLLAGLGAGAIDAGLNAYVALNHSPRLLTWLHASYGLGAALGPTIMIAVLGAGQSWRLGYALVALAQLGLGACFLLTAPRWRDAGRTMATAPAPERMARGLGSLAQPAVWLSILLFLVYTGLEAAAGQWAYSLFTEARDADPMLAALWVSIYWGSLAGGRVAAGFVANQVPPAVLLRTAMLGMTAGAALVWAHPSEALGFLGLGLMGLSAAPIFPTLIAATPRRLGPEQAANVIGLQVGAAALGIVTLPALAGVLAESAGLEIIAAMLLVAALLMLALHEVVLRCTATRAG